MKRCTKCRGRGPFYRNRTTPDGLSFWCKRCLWQLRQDPKRKQTHAARERDRRRTWVGMAAVKRGGILSRVGNADGRHPAYARVELRMTRAEFMTRAVPALRRWVGNNPGKRASIDRRRNAGHYELGNVRIISLSENSRLQGAHKNVHAPRGKAWCTYCRKYRSKKMFYKNRAAPHGLQFLCKRCSGEANKRSRGKKLGTYGK